MRSLLLQQFPVASSRDGLGAVGGIQFAVETADLGLDRAERDHQFGSNLWIGQASRWVLDFAVSVVRHRLADQSHTGL